MIKSKDVTIDILYGEHSRVTSSWGGKGLWNYRDPFVRLYYVDGGRGEVRHQGLTFRLQAGHMYLIPPHVVSNYACPTYLDLYSIHVAVQVFGVINLFSLFKPDYEMDTTSFPYARDVFDRLMLGIQEPGAVLHLEMDGLVQQLLGRFFSSHGELITEARLQELSRMRPVLDYIDANLDRAMTLQDLASILNLHPRYFSNLFSTTMQAPPLSYIAQRRTEKAQTLLSLTHSSIKAIGKAVGYDDEFYFSRVFKKHMGLSPSAYRRQSRDHT